MGESADFPGEERVVWGDSPVVIELHATDAAPLAVDDVRRELESAFGSWSLDCSTLRFVVQDASSGPASDDARNTIGWVTEGWEERGFDALAPAVTEVSAARSADGSMAIVEADVYLNGDTFDWSERAEPPQPTLGPILLHEMGHVAGLAHPCETGGSDDAPDCVGNEAFATNLMHPTYSPERAALSADEVEGICSLYPSGSAEPEPSAGCRADEDCGPSHRCEDERCVTGRAGFGQRCQDARECVSGACASVCVAPCSTDRDCSAGDRCTTTAEGTSACQGDRLAFGEACNDSSECVSGECLLDGSGDGMCTSACTTDDACPATWRCSAVAPENACVPALYAAAGSCALQSSSAPGQSMWIVSAAGLAAAMLLRRRSRWSDRECG